MDVPHHFHIDGLAPNTVERPTTVDGIVAVLTDASAVGWAVAPTGGGGALHLGNLIDRYDLALDMRGMSRILDHQAADLVLSVEAGVSLSDVSEALARHGQWLPIEAPDPSRATIGGLIATALSGPGKLAHGSLRDYLIGISFVTPTSGLAKAGGMVVKNVSGFDLMRLHHGALGTLGVIASANFKVLPAPRGQASVIHDSADLAAALAAIGIVESEGRRTSASVVQMVGDSVSLTARFDGIPGQVGVSATSASARLGSGSRVLVEDESRAWWRELIDGLRRPSGESVEVRFGCRPGGVAATAGAILAAATEHDISTESIRLWPGLGALIIRLHPSVDARALDALLDASVATGATWRVTSAPVSVKAGRDVWGQPPASLATMRRLKEQFDPGRILNPGRFSGHI